MQQRRSKCEIVAWLLIFSLHGVVINVCAQENSLPDSATASPEVRHKLIKEYESVPAGFRDDHLLAVAISYAKEGKFTEAIPVYKQFLNSYPDHTRALRGLGTSYVFQQRYKKPSAVFENLGPWA